MTTRRGLESLRTQSSRTGGRRPRHEVYMRITTLEMERTRRLAELTTTRERLERLEERLAEIDAECARLAAEVETPQGDMGGPAFTLRY